MRGYKYLGYKKGDLPLTERISKEIFSLPMYPKLSLIKVNKVNTEIRGGKKLAFITLHPDFNAMDIATQLGIL